MIMTAGTLRSAYDSIIRVNRRRIVVHFKQTVADDLTGERTDLEYDRGPFWALVERRNSAAARLIADLAGNREVGGEYIMIADHTANLPAGDLSDISATFEVPILGRFKLRDVWPGVAQEQVCGYAVPLEQVA
jgi:hypothetical protein